MKKGFPLFVFTISLLIFSLPVLPASAGLVRCSISGADNVLCDFCSFLATIQATLNFIIGLTFLGAILLIAKSGLDMYLTQGNPGKMQDAMKGILKVVTGLVIVIIAWAIINTIIVFLAKPGAAPTFWNNINC